MQGLGWAAAACAGVIALGMAPAANATIVNISATGFTDVTLDPGEYLVSIVGTAQGGAYNGWNDDCPTGLCASGWSEAFIAESPSAAIGDQIDVFGLGATYASALDALQATQSAATIAHGNLRFGVPNSFSPLPPAAYPLVVRDQGLPTRLIVATADGDAGNNFGGISLSVTPVPEPAAWTLTIAGFGLVGTVLRRRSEDRRRLKAIGVV